MRDTVKPVGLLVLMVFAGIAGAGELVVVAGGGERSSGPATECRVVEPFGVDWDAAGNMYIVEFKKGNRILRVDPAGQLTHFAGTGKAGFGGDGGAAKDATFSAMHAIAVHPSGAIFIADSGNNRLRRIDPSGVVTTFARSERTQVDSNGRPVPDYDFYAITLTPDKKQLILTELVTRRIRALDAATGASRHLAGSGRKGVPADGTPALEARLVDPRCAAADSKGNVYILERGGNALRVVDRNGLMRTVIAADSPVGLKGPKFVAVDSRDRVLITDCEKHRILRYDPATGQTVTIAGSGERGGDLAGGDPLKAQLNRPHGAVEGPDGAIYISDSENHRVLKLVTGEARPASKR